MKIAKYLNKDFTKGTARTEREDYINMCVEEINRQRYKTKYKPMTFMGVKMKLNHLSDADVKHHYYQCTKSGNFSRLFFGLLK